jgi:hypothetical protein
MNLIKKLCIIAPVVPSMLYEAYLKVLVGTDVASIYPLSCASPGPAVAGHADPSDTVLVAQPVNAGAPEGVTDTF